MDELDGASLFHDDCLGVQDLVDRYPTAVVAATGRDGLLADMPDVITLSTQHVLSGRSILEWVVVEDRAVAARAWVAAREGERAEAPVRLLSNPSTWVLLRVFNLLAVSGVVIAVFVPEDIEGQAVDLGLPEATRSRFGSYCENDSGMVTSCDDRSAAVVGFTRAQLIGMSGLDLVHPDDQARAIDGWLEAIATKRPCTTRYRHAFGDSGGWLWVDGTAHSRLDHPEQGDVLIEVIDVSEEVAAKEALEAKELLLNRLAQALPVGVFQVDRDLNVIYSNDRLHGILGVPGAEHIDALLVSVDDEDRSEVCKLLGAVLSNGTDSDLDVGVRSEAGEQRRCLMSIRALSTSTGLGAGAIVCVSDTTDSTRMRLELEDKATFDVLTRCHNRASIMASLDEALTGDKRSTTGVVFIDLDKFKPVNDIYGHGAGDEVLVAVAGRFKSCLRRGDVLGRIGGDEFLIVCRNIGSSAGILAVGERISVALHQQISVGDELVRMSASIGVACSRPGINADELVALADKAMYESKHQGDGLPVLGTDGLPVFGAADAAS